MSNSANCVACIRMCTILDTSRSTNSDSEIQFKVVNEVTEDGQGDVNPMLDQDDATDEEPQHETSIPEDVLLPDAPLPHGHRVQSQSRERLDQLYPRQSPDLGRRVPDRNLLDAGDYARYPAPRPRRRESPRAHSPYRYEGPAHRPVRQQHRLQVKPKFFNVETTGISTSPISRTVQTLAVGQRQVRPWLYLPALRDKREPSTFV